MIQTSASGAMRDVELGLMAKTTVQESPYASWSSNFKPDLSATPGPPPLKCSSEVKANVDQIKRYSPDFTMKKLNNYDNTTKFMHRNVFKNNDIRHHYDKHELDVSTYTSLGNLF